MRLDDQWLILIQLSQNITFLFGKIILPNKNVVVTLNPYRPALNAA